MYKWIIYYINPKTTQRQPKDNPKTTQRQSKDNPKTIQRQPKDNPNTNPKTNLWLHLFSQVMKGGKRPNPWLRRTFLQCGIEKHFSRNTFNNFLFLLVFIVTLATHGFNNDFIYLVRIFGSTLLPIWMQFLKF